MTVKMVDWIPPGMTIIAPAVLKKTPSKRAHTKGSKKVQDLIQVNNFHKFCYYRLFLTLLAALSQNKA